MDASRKEEVKKGGFFPLFSLFLFFSIFQVCRVEKGYFKKKKKKDLWLVFLRNEETV